MGGQLVHRGLWQRWKLIMVGLFNSVKEEFLELSVKTETRYTLDKRTTIKKDKRRKYLSGLPFMPYLIFGYGTIQHTKPKRIFSINKKSKSDVKEDRMIGKFRF